MAVVAKIFPDCEREKAAEPIVMGNDGFNLKEARSSVFALEALYFCHHGFSCSNNRGKVKTKAVRKNFFHVNHGEPYLSRVRC